MTKKSKTAADTQYRVEKVGEVEIDTGTLVIVDPCRINELNLGVFADGFDGQVTGETYKNGRQRKIAVVSSTGIGDGRYPVFAEIVTTPQFGERVAALHIHLDPIYCFADDKKAKKEITKMEAEYLAA